jgi:hypothetical protein
MANHDRHAHTFRRRRCRIYGVENTYHTHLVPTHTNSVPTMGPMAVAAYIYVYNRNRMSLPLFWFSFFDDEIGESVSNNVCVTGVPPLCWYSSLSLLVYAFTLSFLVCWFG